jgi:hypothetical protein
VADRSLELVNRDRDCLDVADDVGELELDEPDPGALGALDGLGAPAGVGDDHWLPSVDACPRT